jgi:hypothetical protein
LTAKVTNAALTAKVTNASLETAPVRHTTFRTLKVNYLPRLTYLIQHHPVHVTTVLAALLQSICDILSLSGEEQQLWEEVDERVFAKAAAATNDSTTSLSPNSGIKSP